MGFKYFSAQPAHEVTGYVVGMDDYHWLVATMQEDLSVEPPSPITLVLVHKAQPSTVTLHNGDSLSQETEEVQKKVRAVGNPYWEYLRSRSESESPAHV